MFIIKIGRNLYGKKMFIENEDKEKNEELIRI